MSLPESEPDGRGASAPARPVHEAMVHTVPMASPSDVSAVAQLIDLHELDPRHVVALIAQTEGDGHARGYAALSLRLLFAERLGLTPAEVETRIPMLMIGGTAGLMSPHVTLFVKRPAAAVPGGPPRLAIGVASTRELQPQELGTRTQALLVAQAVREAMHDAGLEHAEQVACVEMKCPQSTLASTTPAHSRGASALGAAIALGEVMADEVSDGAIGRRADLCTERGSASSGQEQTAVRVVMLGQVAGAPGDFVVGRGVMAHALDLAGAQAAFRAAGLALKDGMVVPDHLARIAAVFVNAGADALPDCLGRRHTLHTDLLSAHAGHVAKAVAHASVAGIAQDTLLLANAGAEHQGRPGSNLLCVVARST
jgi:cyanuric acid amidohydrolase